MAFKGTDVIPGPSAMFKDPDGSDNKVDGVVASGTNRQEVALNIPSPVRPSEGGPNGWLYPDKPGIE